MKLSLSLRDIKQANIKGARAGESGEGEDPLAPAST
jgi:hypothetical protein